MRTRTRNEVECKVTIRRPHPKQNVIRRSKAKRKVVRAGRRGGKTVVAATISVEKLLEGKRVLYAAPTMEQLETWWYEAKKALGKAIEMGVLKKNEMTHSIGVPGTKNYMRGKTAWNADMLRGDYADFLVLDEYQLMNEDAWELVGAPMLLDNDGDAMFIYTPLSLHTKSASKARDPRHAAKMFKKAAEDETGRWAAFHFSSHENPHISEVALAEITQDMTRLAYKQEIEAEDIDEVPNALWTRELVAKSRVSIHPELTRVVVGVDPPGGATECGIVVAGLGENTHGYIIEDRTLAGSPDQWAEAVLTAYNHNFADRVVGEQNFGGDMVESTIINAAKARGLMVSYKSVHASRGKAVRAEPVAAGFEQGRIHLVGEFPYLEDEMCTWVQGESKLSPNRLDAMVWAITELMLGIEAKRLVTFDAMSLLDGDA